MKGVEIESITKIGENDSGSTFELEDLSSLGNLLAFRNKGSISGNHYHKGVSPSKNPEKLVLISGEIQLTTKNIESLEVDETTVKAPALIKIYPNIVHTVEALTAITFMEFNSLEDHKKDTFYLD